MSCEACLQIFRTGKLSSPLTSSKRKKFGTMMGLTIRKHEIIDGLQRQYFPEEFQSFRYADSKPGTGFD